MAKYLSKYDRPVQKDWTYPESIVPTMPTLNYEMLNSMLAQQQGQFDLARTISEKQPQVLQTEEDTNLYKQYQQMTSNGLDQVTNAYASQGAAEGSRAYRQYLDQMRGAWKPGGIADALNNRYTGYFTAKKAIEDQYKDDIRGVNKTLALRQLDNQLKSPINYQDGRYQQITAPDMVKDPQLRTAINDMLKQIGESGDTEFLNNNNKSWWIEKIQTEGRPAERIKLATQALAEQPEFAAQIQRDAQYQALNIDPEKYQSRFNSNLDKQLEQNSKLLEGKNAKELLEQQGYDTSDLSKAKKEYIQDQKNIAEQLKSGFDINQELAKDVYKDYENYALGFANEKIKKDLIFNKEMQVKFQEANANKRARQQTDALLSIRDVLTPKEAPTGTVTSGIAQQLPEIDKHYTNLKNQKLQQDAELNKSLNSSDSVFKGWKVENVVEAHNVWEDTMSKLPPNAPEWQKKEAYAKALQSNSDYQWTPDNLNDLYQQMSSSNNGLKPVLEARQELQDNLERIDYARTNVALQFIDTPEGKQTFDLIKDRRLPNETNEQLVQRALNSPEQFNVKGQRNAFPEPGTVRSSVDYNPAVIFKNQMERGVKENKSNTNYNWGDMATNEISFNADDKLMGPFMKSVGQAAESGTPYRFSSEGKQGLTFRTNDGSEIPVGSEDKVNLTTGRFGVNKKGDPVMTFASTITKGNKTYQTTVDMDIVPGSVEAEQVINGLKNTYVAIYNSGNKKSADAVLNNITRLEKPTKVLSDAGTQVMLDRLTKADAKPLDNIFIEDGDSLAPVSYMGYSGKDTKNSHQIQDPRSGATLNYETYAMIDKQGNKVLGNVFVRPDGKKILKSTHQYMSSVTQERKGDEIRATTDVVRETVKLPEGQMVDLMGNLIIKTN